MASDSMKLPRGPWDADPRFRLILERLSAVAYVATPDEAGSLIYVSPQIEKLLGFSPDEWLADPGLRIAQTHPEDRERVLIEMTRCRAAECERTSEYRMLTRFGRVVWVCDEAGFTKDADGRPTSLIGVLVDITRRKNLETERERLITMQTATRAEAVSARTMAHTVLERVSDAFVALDSDWRYTYVNEKAAQTFSRSPEDLVGKHIWTEFPEGIGQPFYKAYYRAMAEQKPVLIEEHYPPYDRWFENRIYPSEDGLTIYFHDITDQKRAEIALRESEERFRRALDNIPDVVVIYDRDLRIRFINAATRRITGRAESDFIGKRDSEILPPQVYEPYLPTLKSAFETGTVQIIETHLTLPGTGTYDLRITCVPLLDDEGKVREVLGITHDFTERKRADEQIQKQIEMLTALNQGARQLVESLDLAQVAMQVAKSCVDDFGARLAWIGRAEPGGSVSLLTHYPPGIEYPHQIVVRWDDSPHGAGPTGRAIRCGAPVVLDDISTNQTYTPWRDAALAEGFTTSASFPLISRQRPFGILNLYSDEPGFFDDARQEFFQTYAHQAAAALENARLFEELQGEAARLEARVAERTAQLGETNAELEAFASSVAHDLRAPLRAMHGLSQALLEDYGKHLDETGREYARRVVNAAQRMDLLIRDLLAYSRLSREGLERTPISLGAVVASVLAEMESELRERTAIIDCAELTHTVLAHRATIESIITNLISNAVKFVEPGVASEVRLRAEEREGFVRLWVEDNGIGIDPRHQSQIFRVFERLHGIETYPGTGIGLAIVRKGVERLGGQCGVESALGKGSRFWIELVSGAGIP